MIVTNSGRINDHIHVVLQCTLIKWLSQICAHIEINSDKLSAITWAFMVVSCLIHAVQTTVQIGFEYIAVEGENVEVCITVIEGSFADNATLTLIDQRNEVGNTDTAFDLEDYNVQEDCLIS